MALPVFETAFTTAPLPRPDGYSRQEADGALRRTEVEGGPARVRKESDQAPLNQRIQWEMDATQTEEMDTFYQTTLSRGAKVFLMDIWTFSSYEQKRCRFIERPTYNYRSFQEWVVSAQIEILDEV